MTGSETGGLVKNGKAEENNISNNNDNQQPKTKSRKRLLLSVAVAVMAILLIAVVVNHDKISRLYRAVLLFHPNHIEENFRTMNELFDHRTVKRGGQVLELSYEPGRLPELYHYNGSSERVNTFIERTGTTGLIVLQDNTILYEEYFRGNNDASRTISWSLSKSVVSALFGVAVDEGYIKDINEPVTKYLDLPEECGYNGVKIKDVLQMSSGIRFNEDYGDHNSDVNRMGRAMVFNPPLDDFIYSLESEREP